MHGRITEAHIAREIGAIHEDMPSILTGLIFS